MKTNEQEVEELIAECLAETELARKEKYEHDKAERTAALFLATQLKLSYFIEEIELNAKQAKNEIDRIEAEKYFLNKQAASLSKVTESSLVQLVAKDPDVIAAKKEAAEAESTHKKWSYIMNILKDSHIFFRNLGKSSNY